jgi:hypothetical protein
MFSRMVAMAYMRDLVKKLMLHSLFCVFICLQSLSLFNLPFRYQLVSVAAMCKDSGVLNALCSFFSFGFAIQHQLSVCADHYTILTVQKWVFVVIAFTFAQTL